MGRRALCCYGVIRVKERSPFLLARSRLLRDGSGLRVRATGLDSQFDSLLYLRLAQPDCWLSQRGPGEVRPARRLNLDGPPSARVFRKTSNNRVCDGIERRRNDVRIV